jgi:hypothetical protein
MKLTEDNFLLYAMNNYDNTQCHSIEEFEEDLKKLLYIKKLFLRYKNNDDLREKLILNHIIVLYNVFGDAFTNMVFFKIDKEYWPTLITFLVYVNRMPDLVENYGIKLSDIVLDQNVISALRKI